MVARPSGQNTGESEALVSPLCPARARVFCPSSLFCAPPTLLAFVAHSLPACRHGLCSPRFSWTTWVHPPARCKSVLSPRTADKACVAVRVSRQGKEPGLRHAGDVSSSQEHACPCRRQVSLPASRRSRSVQVKFLSPPCGEMTQTPPLFLFIQNHLKERNDVSGFATNGSHSFGL